MTPEVQLLAEALRRALEDLGVPEAEISLEPPQVPDHGDLATNVTLRLAGRLNRSPRELAHTLAGRLRLPSDVVSRVDVAGPGFINFWLADTALTAAVRGILRAGAAYGRIATRAGSGAGDSVRVVFVSPNPRGSLSVAHGRDAVFGDAIASLLEATGHSVTREFEAYDDAACVDRLADDVWRCVRQEAEPGERRTVAGIADAPVRDFARRVIAQDGPGLADLADEAGRERCRAAVQRLLRTEHVRDLENLGIRFDRISRPSEADAVQWDENRDLSPPEYCVRIDRNGVPWQRLRSKAAPAAWAPLGEFVGRVGVDAARYFFLSGRNAARPTVDIDLAAVQSEDNPVYYVQYAHARLTGIVRRAGIARDAIAGDDVRLPSPLAPDARTLVRFLALYPVVVDRAARGRDPHRVVAYLERAARLANEWHHARWAIGTGERGRRADLAIGRAAVVVLANALNLLGISAPERM